MVEREREREREINGQEDNIEIPKYLNYYFKKKKGEKHILVPTFSSDSHFSPYILFLLLLVPILKNAS